MNSPSAQARDAMVTRKGILGAALDLFAEKGFDTVGVRAIGLRAGVDPSLINRYFGSKDHLFIEVIRACRADWKRLWGDREGFSERVVQEVLRGPKGGLALRGIVVMLRSAGSERARLLVEQAIGASLFLELEGWIGGTDADVRARLLLVLLAGMAFAREASGDFKLSGPRADALDQLLRTAIESFVRPGPVAL